MEEKSLKDWIIDKYMSPATLAKNAGVDRALISRLMNGKQSSSKLETVKRIADALGVDPMEVKEFAEIVRGKENRLVAL